jgi:MFS family permease
MTGLNRGIVAGCALGVAAGWNFGSVGAIASELSRSYGVALTTIGLLTTALVVMHVAVQIPAGRASDRFGAVRTGTVALVVVATGNGLALAQPELWVGLGARAVVGVGTGLAFISGSALVRESGGSPLAQGVFGGVSLAPGGLAIAVVPQLEGVVGWRAPYVGALAIAAAALVLVTASRSLETLPTPCAIRLRVRAGVVRDRRLYRLAVLYTASYGLGLVLANWVVELLQRHSGLETRAAGAVGALTLLLVAVSRPLGGWILRSHPRRVRLAVVLSVVAGTAGTAVLVAAGPVWLAVLGSALVGIGAGIPFSPPSPVPRPCGPTPPRRQSASSTQPPTSSCSSARPWSGSPSPLPAKAGWASSRSRPCGLPR